MKRQIESILIILCFCLPIALNAASPITFSGGSTSISKTGDELDVKMAGGAIVQTEDLSLSSDEIRIWGKDYRYVRCTGTVKAIKSDDGITIITPSLFYDRTAQSLLVDSWIEIEDTVHEVALSGAHLDYSLETGVMKLQIQARIIKDTEDGLLSCSADSIEYDSKNQTLVLSGRSDVTWGEDRYQASRITINLETNELKMEGKISGTVNG
ncbi:MAG: LptA/OstA family protein [Sphaerochaetaceae bacterium]|jgi:lipopolysaccharide export system protein LptA|nr:LptA/OstA family protein [Sphaerochaetaceae bacterium]MDD3163542.1 LptA/OstA family protein [Sphaerochaetaceae bacterium]MDD4007211.1 LptA/OstA family protein [Sphaerochaetaceae bacterium]MDD4397131.1 LptA/OstA family protein [Sphaerochaetaceae bacterium]